MCCAGGQSKVRTSYCWRRSPSQTIRVLEVWVLLQVALQSRPRPPRAERGRVQVVLVQRAVKSHSLVLTVIAIAGDLEPFLGVSAVVYLRCRVPLDHSPALVPNAILVPVV